MLPDRVSNPGPLTYESGALPIALRGPAICIVYYIICMYVTIYKMNKICLNQTESNTRGHFI